MIPPTQHRSRRTELGWAAGDGVVLALTARVKVWAGASRSMFHSRPVCGSRRAGQSGTITYESAVEDVVAYLWDSNRSRPCDRCARPLLMDAAVAPAYDDPAAPDEPRTRVVLGCVHARFVQNGSHHRCPSDLKLAALAARHGLVTHTSANGYVLVAADLRPSLAVAAASGYAVYDVPDAVGPLTEPALAAAWAARKRTSKDPGLELHAIRDRGEGIYKPLTRPNFVVGDLITAAPVPNA